MMAGATVTSAYSQGEAARAQGDFQKSQGELNAYLGEEAAKDAIIRGGQEARTSKAKTDKLVASQRVAMAAQGLDINDAGSSGADVLESTRAIGAVDEMNIKTNAWREAYGYKIDAINNRASGQMAAIAGRSTQRQTMIAGGMNAFSYTASGVAE